MSLGATDIGIKTFDRAHGPEVRRDPGNISCTWSPCPVSVSSPLLWRMMSSSLRWLCPVYASGPAMGEPSVGTGNRARGRQQMCDTSLDQPGQCFKLCQWPGLVMWGASCVDYIPDARESISFHITHLIIDDRSVPGLSRHIGHPRVQLLFPTIIWWSKKWSDGRWINFGAKLVKKRNLKIPIFFFVWYE